jgi:two-component system, NtrC family, response regulator HupR/HoxA
MTHPLSFPAQPRTRERRVPLWVPVTTRPALARSWSADVSRSGMRLVASEVPPGSRLGVGVAIEIEFTAPHSGTRLVIAARVAWMDQAPPPRSGVSLGLHFMDPPAPVRSELASLVSSPRFTVAVAAARPEQVALARAALEGHAVTLTAANGEELAALVSRGGVSVVLVWGPEALRLAERVVSAAGATGECPLHEFHSDLGPRVICCGDLADPHLVPLLGSGRVFLALPAAVDGDALRAGVLRACEDLSIRTELWRMSGEVERAQARHLTPRSSRANDALSELWHDGEPMRSVVEQARVFAGSRAPGLVEGETGTGKELLARAIHELSDRAEGPFVVQDCGALSETLLESELFGHARGAFTGAVADHIGLFVAANGGTLFLDEIENMSARVQVKLLRAVETGEVRPLGRSQVHRLDVRIVTATNSRLEDEVAAGRFRADLYYRLCTFPLRVPPLRERPRDVPLLAERFTTAAASALGRAPPRLGEAARRELGARTWPGNVRELRNVIERAVVLAPPGGEIGPELVRDERRAATAGTHPPAGALAAQLEDAERRAIRAALDENGWVLRRAAAALGCDPVTLGRRARRLGLWPAPTAPGGRA